MSDKTVETRANGKTPIKTSMNPRTPYPHQQEAMKNMDLMDTLDSYSTLVVLPTGGGKTYTASTWLLANALDKKKKVLWLAHRQTLLDQAAASFIKYAYQSTAPNISSFTFRIISGAKEHDRMIDIDPNDDLLIASRDSVRRNLNRLDSWLKGEDVIFLVIDEAHHSTTMAYRKVIDYIKKKVPHVKMIGLTATPSRTSENERGLLAKIFTDGIKDNQVVRGDIGIAYDISLKELISKGILSRPIFESHPTHISYGEHLGLKALESIEQKDNLPEDIKEQIAKNAARNKLIVDTYLEKQKEFGQTIVFAVNRSHAYQLSGVFKDAGVAADFVVSDLRDSSGKITVSPEDNKRKMQEYREGKLQILINVEILTEGVDFPQTKTVFLTRPTVSTILMTQMIGRALRGGSGGTELAYIVPFIDDWNDHIAWVNPRTLFDNENAEFKETKQERENRILRLISIQKIEEFAALVNGNIDTSDLEKVPFIKRMPVGMYSFRYLEEDDGADIFYQVMVYDSTRSAYKEMMASLQVLFEAFEMTDKEYIPTTVLREMERRCANTYFLGEMIPSYQSKDIMHILKYYAQKRILPNFYTFDDIDNSRIDPSIPAKKIWDEDMGARQRAEYLNNLWDSKEDNLIRIFFQNKLYFVRSVDIEYEKLAHPELFKETEKVKFGRKKLEDLPLEEIGKIDPELEKSLRDRAFKKALTPQGKYRCSNPYCGRESANRGYFEVDHIVAMNNGGKSVPENLQILCTFCNRKKGDK